MTDPVPYYFSFSDFGIKRAPLLYPGESARRALDAYNRNLTYGSTKFNDAFFGYVNRLVENFVLTDNFGVWPYHYLFQRARLYGCTIPWVSALAQGQGISALLRAYRLSRNKKYLAIANKALRAFEVPTRKGGVLYVDKDDGDWWYEEYASASSIPSGVLNGFVIALLGIYDFYVFTHNQLAEQLFDKGVSTLCRHIKDFDPDYPFKLSYYDRYEHTVSIEYHLLHIKLMQTMHEITKKVIFRKYKERWEGYKEEWLSHRSYRWLSEIYHLKSGFDLKHCIALLASHLKIGYQHGLFSFVYNWRRKTKI